MTGSMEEAAGPLRTSLPSWIAMVGRDCWSVWHSEPSLHWVRHETAEPWALQSLLTDVGAVSTSVTERTSLPGWLRQCRQCEQLWLRIVLLPPLPDNAHEVAKGSDGP